MSLCATESSFGKQIKYVRVKKNTSTMVDCVVISRSYNSSRAATPGQRCVYATYMYAMPSSTSDSIRATHQIIIMCNHEISTFQVPFGTNTTSTWQTEIWDTPTQCRLRLRLCLHNTHTPCGAACAMRRIEFFHSSGCRPKQNTNEIWLKTQNIFCQSQKKTKFQFSPPTSPLFHLASVEKVVGVGGVEKSMRDWHLWNFSEFSTVLHNFNCWQTAKQQEKTSCGNLWAASIYGS